MEIDIYALTHEIKNPLSIAKGYLEMSNQNNFAKYKELIDSNINEALNILDSYLEYNKMILKNEVIDIILLLEEVRNNYIDLYDIKININSLYEELFIEADYYKLKQVFNNLIKNSIEAKCKNIDIFIKKSEDELSIKIVDDGEGFNNVNNLIGYSNKVNGNGIGLLITDKILNLHDGNIEYANNEEIGCNILIKLPVRLYF